MRLFRNSRMSDLMKFVHTNDPNAAYGTGGDMWKRYLANKGATGDTFHDLEQSYLRILNKPTWSSYLSSLGHTIGGIAQQVRSWLASTLSSTSYFLKQEDDTSFFTLEDNSGIIRVE